MSNKGKLIVFTAINITLLTFGSKIFGFMRETIMAAYFGAGMAVDSYQIATIIPILLFAGVATAVTVTFIPRYTSILANEGLEKANLFTSNLASILTYLTVLLVLISYWFTPTIVSLIAPGFSGEKYQLTVDMTRITLPAIIFNVWAGLLTGFLNVKKNFFVPALIGYPLNIIMICSIVFFSSKFSIYSLAWGTLLGIASQAIIQLPFAVKEGFRFSIVPDFKDKHIRVIAKLSLPVLFSTAIVQLNYIVDRIIASGLPDGAIASLTYSSRLLSFVMAMFVSSIATVFYPSLSDLALTEDKEDFKRSFNNALKIVCLFVIPMAIGLGVLRIPIVEILYKRGAFDLQDTVDTANALLMFSVGLLGLSLKEILNRVFFSLHDTLTPMINSGLAVILNIILSIFLAKKMGHSGIALGTSISAIFTVLLLFVNLRRKLGSINGSEFLSVFLRMSAAGIIMGLCSYYLNIYLPNITQGSLGKAIHLLGVITISGTVYFTFAYVLGVKEVRTAFGFLRQKLSVLIR